MVDLAVVVVPEPGDGLVDALRAAAVANTWIAVVRDADSLAPGALDEVAAVLDADPDTDIVYGDELRSGDDRTEPFYKPAWSPDRLRSQHLLSGLTVYSARVAARAVEVVRPASTAMAALHDLALAAGEIADSVVHIPTILATVAGPTAAWAIDPAAVDRHLRRRGLPMRAVASPHGAHLIGYEPALGERPLVSVIVPTGGTLRRVRGRDLALVDNAIASLVERSTYEHFEIVAVIDHKSTQALADRLVALAPDRLRVVKDERPFNFAAAANLGVREAAGEMLLLLNDDTEVLQADWIERLVALASDDGVGAVGAKLFYGDGRIQHAGITIRRGRPDHAYHGYPGDFRGHGDELNSTINASSSTGACLLVRRDHWEAVGGMSETFPLNYNDADLCLKLDTRGWRTIVDNTTTLTHLETSSRPRGSETWEDERFVDAWPEIGRPDPFDSPNFVDLGMEHLPKPPSLVALRRSVEGAPASRRWGRGRSVRHWPVPSPRSSPSLPRPQGTSP